MDIYDQPELETGRINGLMYATVLSNNDSGHKGTLKVQLLSQGQTKNILEGVKVMTPLAGETYGAYLLPEAGDLVLVGFVDGYYHRPVVLGALYAAGDQMLADSFDKNNTLKRLVTKGGCIVEISDAKDKERITVKTPEKLSAVLQQETQTITLTAGKTSITLDGKNGKIIIEGENGISLKTGSAELAMEKNGKVALKGASLEIKAKSAKVESQGGLVLKGQKSELSGSIVEVQSQGILTLKGNITKIN